MRNISPYNDIARTTLAVLSIGILIVAVFWIIKPFLLAMVWASMYVVATWPLLIRLEKLLWGKRGLAAAAMTVMLALVFVVPLVAALSIIEANMDRIVAWLTFMNSFVLPPPPHWVEALPIFGTKLSAIWHEASVAGAAELSVQVVPNAEKIATWFISQAGTLGKTTFDFLLTVIISGVLYSTGDGAAKGLLRFAHRLAGDRGEIVMILAARTVRGVALGVVVTALVQATAGGIGLAVAGVPAVALLSAVMFILCLVQLGPALIMFPAAIWLFWSGHTIGGALLFLWAIMVSTIDNFLRPMLIRKSVDIPTLLIFPGVIGGLMALGIVGVFIGPVILAVTYSLISAWVQEGEEHD